MATGVVRQIDLERLKTMLAELPESERGRLYNAMHDAQVGINRFCNECRKYYRIPAAEFKRELGDYCGDCRRKLGKG
jgi:hypothetical protein